jgi:hypothetical protein
MLVMSIIVKSRTLTPFPRLTDTEKLARLKFLRNGSLWLAVGCHYDATIQSEEGVISVEAHQP